MLSLCYRSIKDFYWLASPHKIDVFLNDCVYAIVPEQKARTVYDNILRLTDDDDVRQPIKFLRAREIVHFQRFGETNRTDLSE